jgi:P-type conjugative transfer protein TrbJ
MAEQRRFRPTPIVACLVGTLVGAIPVAAGGGSVLGTGGALEITQLLNHAELIKEVAQQAEQISNQIRQYATMIQNLRQLPENWIGQVTMPYREAYSALMQIKGSVDELRAVSESVGQIFSRRTNAMRLLDMTPEDYVRAELRLAQEWGGQYEKALDADLRSLEKAVDKAEALRRLSDSIPAISGNVEGLQNLAAHATMMAGELFEMRTSIQRQHALVMQDKHAQEQAIELQAQRNLRALQELEIRRRRDAGFTAIPFRYPEWR